MNGRERRFAHTRSETRPLGHPSYFAVTNARVAILTNGETYEFYTDLDAPNRMGSKLYLVLDLTAIDETLLPEVAKLTKESFDLDSVVNAAGELKIIGQIKRLLTTQFNEPSDQLLRLFAANIYPGGFYPTYP
jgi:predicted type IV restriction endonuclease